MMKEMNQATVGEINQSMMGEMNQATMGEMNQFCTVGVHRHQQLCVCMRHQKLMYLGMCVSDVVAM